jgi:hypothetical protein
LWWWEFDITIGQTKRAFYERIDSDVPLEQLADAFKMEEAQVIYDTPTVADFASPLKDCLTSL